MKAGRIQTGWLDCYLSPAQPLLIVWILGDVTRFVITSLWVIAVRTEEDRNSAQSNLYKLKKQVEKSPKDL